MVVMLSVITILKMCASRAAFFTLRITSPMSHSGRSALWPFSERTATGSRLNLTSSSWYE